LVESHTYKVVDVKDVYKNTCKLNLKNNDCFIASAWVSCTICALRISKPKRVGIRAIKLKYILILRHSLYSNLIKKV